MRILSILLFIAFTTHAQVNGTFKSVKIINSDSTHGELDGIEYRTSAGLYRYKENGVWYYRASTAFVSGKFWPLSGTAQTSGEVTIQGNSNNLILGEDLNRFFRVDIFTENNFNVNSGNSINLNADNGFNLNATSGNGIILSDGNLSLTSNSDIIINGTEVSIQGTAVELPTTLGTNNALTRFLVQNPANGNIFYRDASSIGNITGTGSVNRIPYWTSSSNLSFGPYWDNTNENMGIGAAPISSRRLTVNGLNNSIIRINSQNGFDPTLEFTENNSTTSGQFWQIFKNNINDAFHIFNGSDRLVISSAGAINISTTPVNDNTETSILVRQSDGEIQTRDASSLGTIGGTIAATQVGYGSGTNTLTSEAAFNYIAGTNTLTVDNIASGSATIQVNNGVGTTIVQSPTIVIDGTGSGLTGNVQIQTSGTGRISLVSVSDIQFYTGGAGVPRLEIDSDGSFDLSGDPGTSGQAWVSNGSGSPPTWQTITPTPGGSNTQVQFNNSGAFGGDADLTFSGTTLTATNVSISSLTSGNVPFVSTGGSIVDESNFAYNSTTNSVSVTNGSGTVTRLIGNSSLGGSEIVNGTRSTTFDLNGINSNTPSALSNSVFSLSFTGGASASQTGFAFTSDSSSLLFILSDLPTSSAGLPSGAVWSNSGVLNIVP